PLVVLPSFLVLLSLLERTLDDPGRGRDLGLPAGARVGEGAPLVLEALRLQAVLSTLPIPALALHGKRAFARCDGSLAPRNLLDSPGERRDRPLELVLPFDERSTLSRNPSARARRERRDAPRTPARAPRG